MRFCDELEFAFGWITEEEPVRRTSHVLVDGGGVWFVDPVAWPEAERRAAELGEPRGVIQLYDRHDRDSAELAGRLGVPHHRVPARVEGTPVDVVPVLSIPPWHEVALWWPERRTLVVADAVGTLPYFRAPGEALGVHPLLRLLHPPRALRRVFPEHILCGHGEGVHTDAAHALHEALRTARRRLPSALVQSVRRRP